MWSHKASQNKESVALERFFNRVVKTNLFQLGVWVRCKAPSGSGAEPRRQADFDNNLLKINCKSGIWVDGRIGSADRSCDKSC